MAAPKRIPKKSYTPPRLTRYGDLKTLTKGQAANKTEQSALNSTHKTKMNVG